MWAVTPAQRDAAQPADPLDEVVVWFPDADRGTKHPWTVRDACEGTQVFGATGSGKTTGSGRHIAMGMLGRGFGGLILCAKDDELRNWTTYARESGRQDDLAVLDPRLGSRFDFLDYEFQQAQGGELTQNLVSLFSIAIAATGADDRGSSNDPYWADALRQLVTNAIDLAAMSEERVRLADVNRIIITAPQSARVRRYLRSNAFCAECLKRASQRVRDGTLPADRHNDLEQTIEYWLSDFAGLSPRTRSIIVSSFTSRVTGLLRGPLQPLFCPADEAPSGKPGARTTASKWSVRPEDSRAGRIIVLNLPIKTFGEVGRFAQIIFKTIWQRAIERIEPATSDRTVFLWADESQYFVTEHDVLYQQTARSRRAATVYLTQSLPNYYSMLATRDPTSAAHSLLGNLQTKIFHANGDPATNEWAERMFGFEVNERYGKSRTRGEKSSTLTTSMQEGREPIVPSRNFATLRKGGRLNKNRVGAIVFQGGRVWEPADEHDPCRLGDSIRIGAHVLHTWFEQAGS